MPDRYLRIAQIACKQVSEFGLMGVVVIWAVLLMAGFLAYSLFGMEVDPTVARLGAKMSLWFGGIALTSFLIRKLAVEPAITARLIRQLYK